MQPVVNVCIKLSGDVCQNVSQLCHKSNWEARGLKYDWGRTYSLHGQTQSWEEFSAHPYTTLDLVKATESDRWHNNNTRLCLTFTTETWKYQARREDISHTTALPNINGVMFLWSWHIIEQLSEGKCVGKTWSYLWWIWNLFMKKNKISQKQFRFSCHFSADHNGPLH